jgi:hypothetical protein
MSNSRTDELLELAIQPSSVTVQGPYTQPRSWGVYEIEPSRQSGATKRFRFGNHPVRQRELESEFGVASFIALFLERVHAEELTRHLNQIAQIV